MAIGSGRIIEHAIAITVANAEIGITSIIAEAIVMIVKLIIAMTNLTQQVIAGDLKVIDNLAWCLNLKCCCYNSLVAMYLNSMHEATIAMANVVNIKSVAT
jgi:hypothetical protein